MVSCSPGFEHCNPAGLVDGSTDPSLWQSDPNTDVTSCSTVGYVQVDLGQTLPIAGVHFWQYYGDGRSYCGQLVELSSTCKFAGEQTAIYSCASGCAATSAAGVTAYSASPVAAQCVRWSSSRNNINTGVHFLELQVFAASQCVVKWPVAVQILNPRVQQCKSLAENYCIVACNSWGQANSNKVLAEKKILYSKLCLLPLSQL